MIVEPKLDVNMARQPRSDSLLEATEYPLFLVLPSSTQSPGARHAAPHVGLPCRGATQANAKHSHPESASDSRAGLKTLHAGPPSRSRSRAGDRVLGTMERNPELWIMQSIFRSASRREALGKHSKGRRRDAGLKMDWTKPLPRAWPMCIECRLDLG
jgi:hypothetical protein